jgi:hypothetical protein
LDKTTGQLLVNQSGFRATGWLFCLNISMLLDYRSEIQAMPRTTAIRLLENWSGFQAMAQQLTIQN